jgi:large subunit ribosomal protein L3
MKFILGKKIGMSQVFQDDKVIPVSLIEAGPCQVTQVKDQEKDGYQAVQVGFDKKKDKFKVKREFRFSGESNWKAGDEIKVDLFQPGDLVTLVGQTKGKGFQGVVKRWGFSGTNATHGGKGQVRTIGSVGCRFPQRVIKGRRMPGRMGNDRKTLKKIQIIEVDSSKNLLVVKGSIPGPRYSLLMIQGS